MRFDKVQTSTSVIFQRTPILANETETRIAMFMKLWSESWNMPNIRTEESSISFDSWNSAKIRSEDS